MIINNILILLFLFILRLCFKTENLENLKNYRAPLNLLFQRSEFGKGTYFSSELEVNIPYSSVGYGWGGSLLGNEINCTALCELINHPDVKRGDSSKHTI